MAATTKLVLYKSNGPNKNGKFPVKIQVIYNRFVKRFGTRLSLSEEDYLTLHLKKSLKKDFKYLNYCIEKADKIIEELGHDFSWNEFKRRFYDKNGSGSTTSKQKAGLLDYISEKKEWLRKVGKIRTASTYEITGKHIKQFIGNDKIPFRLITPEFLNNFEDYLLHKHILHSSRNGTKVGLSYSSIGIDMRNIRACFNEAISAGTISREKYPFGRGKYVIPATVKAKKALNIEDIQKLIEYKSENESSVVAWAIDLWIFSYLSNGMNIKDIAFLKYENIDEEKNLIIFYREKTKGSKKYNLRPIEVPLTEKNKRIINKWGKKPRRKDSFIFDILHPDDLSPMQIYRDVHQATKQVNKYLKRVSEKIGLKRIPTTNFARHSYSTVLKRAGVPIEMISEMLGHSSIRTTQIYLDSFEPEQKLEVAKYLTAFKTKEENKER